MKLLTIAFRVFLVVLLGAIVNAPAVDGREEPVGSKGSTTGTFVSSEERADYLLMTIRDENGREHQFFALGVMPSTMGYLTNPNRHKGERIAVDWEYAKLPKTEQVMRRLIDIGPPDVRTPAKGSTERKAIIEAVRAAYQERFNKRPTLDVTSMAVSKGWAVFVGMANDPGGKRDGWNAMLRGSGAKWTVVDAERDNLELARRILREHPDAPVPLRAELDFY